MAMTCAEGIHGPFTVWRKEADSAGSPGGLKERTGVAEQGWGLAKEAAESKDLSAPQKWGEPPECQQGLPTAPLDKGFGTKYFLERDCCLLEAGGMGL